MTEKKNFNPLEFITQDRVERLKQVLEKRTDSLTLVMENINDPHNLSAVVRSCDSIGIFEICLLYHGEQEPRSLDKVSSASASKWINTRYFLNVEDCYEYLRKKKMKIFTTHLEKPANSIFTTDFLHPTAIVFGNEHSGVSEEAYDKADGNILIPQVGMIKSLNISVAAAVTLFEAFRQRLQAGYYDNVQLDTEVIETTLRDWSEK